MILIYLQGNLAIFSGNNLNKSIVYFSGLWLGDLTKDDIANYLEWLLEVISDTLFVPVYQNIQRL